MISRPKTQTRPRALVAVQTEETEAARLAANTEAARTAAEAARSAFNASQSVLEQVTAEWQGKEAAALEAFERAPESTDELRRVVKDARSDRELEVGKQKKRVDALEAELTEAVRVATEARTLELEHATAPKEVRARRVARGLRAAQVLSQLLEIDREANAEANELVQAFNELARIKNYSESRANAERDSLVMIILGYLTETKSDLHAHVPTNGPVSLDDFARLRDMLQRA